MAESVDALVSNTSGAIHPGSIPGLGTKDLQKQKNAASVTLAVFCFFYSVFYFGSVITNRAPLV